MAKSSRNLRIDICVATYRRPVMLRQVLISLLNQTGEESIDIRIVVVDNDRNETARTTVKAMSEITDIPIIYEVEKKKNISCARNKAISLTRGDFIAFVDDDEEADAHWLTRMVNAAQISGADIVFGPVLSLLPEGIPDWIKRGRFFERRRRRTGVSCSYGASGNVLISRKVVVEAMPLFKHEYGLTGGEDTEFFCRMGKQGRKMIWCDEGLVYEHVSKDRINANWLIKRAFRGGQTYARIFYQQKGPFEKTTCIIKRISYILIITGILPFLIALRQDQRVHILQKLASSIGHLVSQAPIRYEEYADDGQ